MTKKTKIENFKETEDITSQLHPFQREILEECLKKKNGGLALPMGSGKTLIALELAQKLASKKGKVLIVASKSLVGSWDLEIRKWFPDLKYQIINLAENFDPKAKFYLTTPTTLVKFYKQHEIENEYTEDIRGTGNNANYLGYRGFGMANRRAEFGAEIKHYRHLTGPLLENTEGVDQPSFYSIPFDVLIVDEAHTYLNIQTERCRAICSVYAKHRWLLSGTLFAEPKPCNILGFHKMIGDRNFPDNLPAATDMIKSRGYKGVSHHLVHRAENEMFINRPKLTREIISYNLSDFESRVYTVFKNVINNVYAELHRAQLVGNDERVRNLNASLLSMILILRLSIVAPVIPITRMYMSLIDKATPTTRKVKREAEDAITNLVINDDEGGNGEGNTEPNVTSVYGSIKTQLAQEGILEALDYEHNLVSTRLNKTLDLVNKHSKQKIVIFSTFRTVLSFVERLLEELRTCYVLLPVHNIKRRQEIIEAYSKDPTGVLLLTYDIGSDGLNLQFASVVIVLDVWWNEAKTRQALARVYRYGQTQDVNVYMFRSNTYIEHAMFQKHRDKANIADELLTGPVASKVTKIPMREIVNLMNFSKKDLDDAIRCI